MKHPKAVVFCGSSRKDLRDFPDDARRDTGFELERVQKGNDPIDWKPMPTIGKGVREIRVSDRPGEFRVIYVASIGAMIYVLHAFHKKAQKTPQRDIALATARFREIAKE
jgi:phage-related protein